MQEGILDQRYVASFRLVFTKKANTYENSPRISRRGRNGEITTRNVIGLNNSASLMALRSGPMYVIGGGMGGMGGGMVGGPISGRGGMGRMGGNMPGFVETSVNVSFFDKLSEWQDQLLIGSQQSHPTFYPVEKEFFLSKMPPEKNQMEKEIAAAFEKKDILFIENNFSNDQTGDPAFVQIRLLSPTAEETKKCVEAWMAFYDWSICYPGQKECLDIRKKRIQMLAEYSDKLKKAESDLSIAQKEADKYKEFEDITPEALVTLKTQRRMLAVDLAGINARIKACQEMAQKGHMPEARRDQLETARVAAEIELRGLNAKQAEIDGIIQGAQNLQKIVATNQQFPLTISSLKRVIDAIQYTIKEIEDYQLGYQPLPIEDGKIAIRRIKWISPQKSEKPKPDTSPAK
jgi:hypothetical protein